MEYFGTVLILRRPAPITSFSLPVAVRDTLGWGVTGESSRYPLLSQVAR
jgi:hypothetical protein